MTAARLSLALLLAAACAHRPAPAPATAPPPPPATAAPAPSPAAPAEAAAVDPSAADGGVAEADDEEGDATEDAADPERESRAPAPPGTPDGPRYTADLSDAALVDRWVHAPESLGSIAMGFADEGRLLNGVQFPPGDGYLVVSPEKTWATRETVDFVLAAIHRVRELHPNAPPLRVNQISGPEGGYLHSHHSHQNGRDVDLAFYYPTVEPIRARQRERVIDVALCWELVKALVQEGDVEFILVDWRVQKVLYDHAAKLGEDASWARTLLRHARGHRDHFHVRYFNARAQELGRRVAPLLAQRPDQNRLFYRVRQGDTLGALARRYGSSVAGIMKVNHLAGTMLHLSQMLQIPLRGPCTQCPIPAPVVVPPRRLPPATAVAQTPPAEPQPQAAVAKTPEPAASAPPAGTVAGTTAP